MAKRIDVDRYINNRSLPYFQISSQLVICHLALVFIITPHPFDINYNFGHIKRSSLSTIQLLMTNFNDFTVHGYKVVRELGANRGAGRIAYLARSIDSEQFVVIKQFQFAQGSGWDGHKEIDREVKILQQLQHPNIPRYLTSFETPQSSCIVQEYIDGKPLSEIISNQQLYTPEQVKEIILKLLEVLVYLQKTFTDPVLHRDIKPANILIDSSCEPYLIDFGGAKVSEGVGGSTVSVGTLGFMPPEQRFQQFNKTTDIYSLGMSIVCWLTRTEPTEMYNIINMGTNQVMGLRELLSAYSLRFVDWLEKVVQPDPKNRYSDAEAAFNAFKPLYVKRVPEAIVSSSILEFTASKLGERITQTLMVRNNVPETVLEGWWEVAPHPSDPPHTPNSHAWISFGSRKFSGNANECSIVVNTDKLMAGKVYKRQLLLHSNSSEEIEELEIRVKTAEIPIKCTIVPYGNLLFLLLLSTGVALIISAFFNQFISIITVIPGLIIYAAIIIIIAGCLFSGSAEVGCGGVFGVLLVVALFGKAVPKQIFEFDVLNKHSAAILPLLIMCVLLCGVLFLILKILDEQKMSDMLKEQKYVPIEVTVLLTIICGSSVSASFFLGLHSIWFPIILLLTSVPLISALSYPIIKQKKLVSKYRDSEEGLIKP
jgi:serine/threonine protein kinase